MKIKGKRIINNDSVYLIDYNKKLFSFVFPKKKGVKMNKYQLTNVGYYSISYAHDAERIASILRTYFLINDKPIITDATANVGGDTMAFTNHFYKVNAVEINNIHCKVLKNNLTNYKVLDKVNIYCDDYLNIYKDIHQDIIYFDPPWGGKDYKDKKIINLYLSGVDIIDIAKEMLIRCKFIAIKVPTNYNLKKLIKISNNHDVYKIYKHTGKIKFYVVVLHN
jgi:16S rRNA G966 N2-methylase RsmD